MGSVPAEGVLMLTAALALVLALAADLMAIGDGLRDSMRMEWER
jgi:hypothetical protein